MRHGSSSHAALFLFMRWRILKGDISNIILSI